MKTFEEYLRGPDEERYTFWLKAGWEDKYTEVTREQFKRAESGAGFHPKGGGDHLATAGFSNSMGASGKIRNRPEYEAAIDEYLARRGLTKEE